MLRRRLLTSALVGLLFALAAGVLGQAYASGLPDEYTAESVVLFASRPTENGGVTGSDAVQASASGYVAFLTAPSTLREVADAIGEDPVALRAGLTAVQLPATATIRINYATTDPDRAARGANALASAVAARTVSDEVVFAQVLARAAVPLNPSGPPRTILLAASVLVALLVGAGAATAAWILLGFLDRRRAHAHPGPEVAVSAPGAVTGSAAARERDPVAAPEPEAAPVTGTGPVADAEPVVESAPVVEDAPVAEPEPVDEPEPAVAATEPAIDADPEPELAPEPAPEPEPDDRESPATVPARENGVARPAARQGGRGPRGRSTTRQRKSR